MTKERKKADRERAARRYAQKRQDPEWMKRQAAKKRAQYKPRSRHYRNNLKRRNKALVASLKLSASNCCDCNLVITRETLYLFDFDHREPHLKKFALSMVRTESVESIVEEVSKCDVVCKNCHAHRTHRQRKDIHVEIIRQGRQRQLRINDNQPRLFDET